MVKNIKLNRGEEHLLDHVEAQEFRDHSLAKRNIKFFRNPWFQQSLIMEIMTVTVRVSAQRKCWKED